MSDAVPSRRKVAVIGAGAVGTTIAYAAMIRGAADEFVLIDSNGAKAEGEVKDLNHGLPFAPAARVAAGTVADCARAAVVVVTAGAKQKPGQTRLDLAAANVAMLRELVPQIVRAAPAALLLIVSNPVDVLTDVALRLSGLPERQVFGSGTVLDTSRFRWLIAERIRVAVNNVHAYIIGEHGDSEVPLWSSARAGGVALHELRLAGHHTLTDQDRREIIGQVRGAAQQIIAAKGATNWAIGLAATRILEAVLRDEQAILPVSRRLNGYQGIADVCLSIPSVVGAAGVGPPLPLVLDESELAALRRSAEVVRSEVRKVLV